MSKTQLTPRDEKGRFGAAYVKSIVETGWRAILQDFQGTNDRGLDGIILDVHRGRLTSLQFDVQIKTSTFNMKFPGDSFPAPVDRGHLALWRDSNVPVVLICVDYGSPPSAFWRVIRPDEEGHRIRMSRRNVFGPASRDDVVAAIQDAFPKRISSICGGTLSVPLNLGIRDVAKDYYYRNLMGKPHDNPVFGPIEFTWKGWRHITRRGRSMRKVLNSLLLLPCVRSILAPGVLPTKWRPLTPIQRGSRVQYRTLLAFDSVVTFRYRAPAWVRTVVEHQVFVPLDWPMSPPDDSRRAAKYKFLSVYELARHVGFNE